MRYTPLIRDAAVDVSDGIGIIGNLFRSDSIISYQRQKVPVTKIFFLSDGGFVVVVFLFFFIIIIILSCVCSTLHVRCHDALDPA